MKILDEIAEAARVRVEKKKSELPLPEVVERAEELGEETDISDELRECADVIAQTDERMLEIRKQIEARGITVRE